jgi:hypothetical protein
MLADDAMIRTDAYSRSAMTPVSAWSDGIRRVNSAPAVLVGMFLLTLLVALPLSFALRGMLEQQLADSLAAETLSSGTSYDWWQEFSAQASGLGTTFVPSIIGFGAVLDNISGVLDNLPLATTIVGVTAAWLVIWSFLSGGVLDRYARRRPTRAHGFFAACGTHFWRFLRIGVIALLVYWILFGFVHPWLFEDFYPWATRDMTAERVGLAVRLACYVAFGALLVACNLVFDYARIRTVVEDRHSAVGALAAGGRFVRRHSGAVRLYLLNGAVFVVLALVYAIVAPGAPGGMAIWFALALGQVYILLRHYLKLLFYASQTAFFQSALAHADYTAAPPVVWPESPAAEAIGNAKV